VFHRYRYQQEYLDLSLLPLRLEFRRRRHLLLHNLAFHRHQNRLNLQCCSLNHRHHNQKVTY
jgi:hypothetical protein